MKEVMQAAGELSFAHPCCFFYSFLLACSSDGSSSGYAVFEVDGKNTGAIAVGETFDKGYFLKSIGEDSAEVMFQGKPHQIVMATKRF